MYIYKTLFKRQVSVFSAVTVKESLQNEYNVSLETVFTRQLVHCGLAAPQQSAYALQASGCIMWSDVHKLCDLVKTNI